MQLEVLVIDEMSMVGQKADQKIDETCRRLTGQTNERYGGITIAYCGDFAQLPPVCDQPLYSNRDPIALQNYVNTFQIAICLTKNHRFANPHEAAIMDQCRVGKLTRESVNLLNTRVLPVPQNSGWFATACRTNKARSQVIQQNMVSACQAHRRGQLVNRVFRFDARFSPTKSRGAPPLTPADKTRVCLFLAAQPDDKLKHMPATLHAFVGMHIIVTKNISLPLGQGNGTLGLITGFVWPPAALSTTGEVLGGWEKIFPNSPDDALVFVPTHPPNEIILKPLIAESQERLSGTEFRLIPRGMFPID